MKLQEIKIGTKVNYYSIITDGGTKIDKKETEITSEAWELGHGDIVCKVNDISGGVLISHLELR